MQDEIEELEELLEKLPVKKCDFSFSGDRSIIADLIIHAGYRKQKPAEQERCKHKWDYVGPSIGRYLACINCGVIHPYPSGEAKEQKCDNERPSICPNCNKENNIAKISYELFRCLDCSHLFKWGEPKDSVKQEHPLRRSTDIKDVQLKIDSDSVKCETEHLFKIKEAVVQLRHWWSFNESQEHTNSYHDREKYLSTVFVPILKELYKSPTPPLAVVWPEKKEIIGYRFEHQNIEAKGWNACLAECKRLNKENKL